MADDSLSHFLIWKVSFLIISLREPGISSVTETNESIGCWTIIGRLAVPDHFRHLIIMA